MDILGDPSMELHAKLKRMKGALMIWSKETYGTIFNQRSTLEYIIKIKEATMKTDLPLENRANLKKTKAELKRSIKIGEEY